VGFDQHKYMDDTDLAKSLLDQLERIFEEVESGFARQLNQTLTNNMQMERD
jgi:DNA anti-recombination protein RmuC